MEQPNILSCPMDVFSKLEKYSKPSLSIVLRKSVFAQVYTLRSEFVVNNLLPVPLKLRVYDNVEQP